MSDNIVDFKLILNDKEFEVSAKNAGKLLKQLSVDAGLASKKISNLDVSVNSLTRNIKIFTVAVGKAASELQDLGVGAELAGNALRDIRTHIAAISRSLTVFNDRVGKTTTALKGMASELRKVQSELSDFSDYANHAGKSTRDLTANVDDLNKKASTTNRRLNNTTKALAGWKDSGDKAKDALKEIISQMDTLIDRQKELKGLGRADVGGPGRGGRGGSGGSGGSGGGHHHSSSFGGVRGTIFALGEVGDAARNVRDMLFGWQAPIIEAAAEMQKMQVLLQGINKDAADPFAAAAKDMDYIIATAKSAPFAMGELTGSFVKFKSAGLDPTNGSWKTLIDSVARFGGNSETLDRAAVAIQQMAGKGVISMEELRQQLGEAVPTAMKAMADGMGVTVAELTKQISTGTVNAQEGLRLMFIGMDAMNRGAAKSMMTTYIGALAQMKTAFIQFSKTVGDSGYLEAMSKSLNEITALMNSTDGRMFAASLGQNLATAITSLTSMARWLVQNRELIINLGAAIAAFVGFRLLRSGILGVISVGSQMGSVLGKSVTGLQAPFNLLSASVTRFNRASRLGLGTVPALLFSIRGGLTAVKAAFASLSAFIVSNPIGVALLAISTAVGAIVWAMEKLRDKTAQTVEELKKMPEAMTQVQRTQIMLDVKKRNAEIERDENLLQSIKSGKLSADALPADIATGRQLTVKDVENRVKTNKAINGDYTGLVTKSDEIKAKETASGVTKAVFEDIDKRLNVGMAKFAAGQMRENEAKRIALDADKSLSKEEKDKRRDEINRSEANAQADLYKKAADEMEARVKSVATQVKNLDEALSKPGLSEDQRKILTAQKYGYASNYEESKQQLDDMRNKEKDTRNSRHGIPDASGEYSSASGTKADHQVYVARVKNDFKNGATSIIGEDGQVAKDVLGNDIEGINQFRANETIISKYGSNVTGEQRKKAEEALTAAILRDTQIRTKAAETASKKEESANNKAQKAAERKQRELQKEADGYNKTLNSSEQMISMMETGSKRTVSFAQNVEKTSVSLEKLANSSPTELITQEMIDKAKEYLATMKTLSPDYLKRLEKKAAKKDLDDVAPNAAGIISSGLDGSQSRDEQVEAFRTKYDESLNALESRRKQYMSQLKDDPSMQVYVEESTKRINQLIKSGNVALIKETGTATQKLALEYGDLATQIESVWADTFSGLTDTLTEFFSTGKASFSDFASSIMKDITKMIVKSQITLPLMNMLGMGSGQTAMQQTGQGNLMSSLANQSVSLFSGAATNGGGTNVVNGDGNVATNSKTASQSVGKLGSTTASTTEGVSSLGTAVVGVGGALSNVSTAVGSQTKAIMSNIFSMKGLQTASNALMFTFAAMSASSSSKTSKWLGFAGTVASGVASIYAGGGFSGGGSGGGSGESPGGGTAIQNAGANYKFAKGGIMGPDGALPLHKYAKGGIATSPQLALFGEGSHNEAYVPLPDGRSIPVTMSAEKTAGLGAGAGVVAPVSISINVQADGVSSASGADSTQGWKDAAEKMKAIALDTIRQEKRPGGSLNANTTGNR